MATTKTTTIIYLEATKNIDGQKIFAKSEAIWKVGERISRGRKISDGTKWAYDAYSYTHVPGFGSNADETIRELFSSVTLNEGATVEVRRPMTSTEFKQLVRETIPQEADRLIKEYCSPIRIKVSIAIDEPVLTLRENGVQA